MTEFQPYMSDDDAWWLVEDEDRWIFDKMLLASHLGYKCGPRGTAPPEGVHKVVVRPCVNTFGMGQGAYATQLTPGRHTDHLPVGSFWCERFAGIHLSVDYIAGSETLVVEGYRDHDQPFEQFVQWIRVPPQHAPKPPAVVEDLIKRYPYVNVEYIDGKVIEIHFRLNPDWRGHESKIVYPVFRGDARRYSALMAEFNDDPSWNWVKDDWTSPRAGYWHRTISWTSDPEFM